MTQIVDLPLPAPPSEPESTAQRLTGMQALARILTEQARLDRRAGLRTGGFVSGYPGSPVAKLHDLLERDKEALATLGIHHRPGLNEELAATAVWGSQTVTESDDALVDGVFAMWYGKAPGVDRAGDALHHGNMRGTARHGGVVLVAGDDPKPNATVYPSDSVPTLTSWGIPVFFPGTAQEIVDLGLHAYALSRVSGLWTTLKMVTAVADGSGVVDSADVFPILPRVQSDGTTFVPQLRLDDAGIAMVAAERDLAVRQQVAAEYARLNDLNPVVVPAPGASIGIVAPGKTYYDLRAALDKLGLDDNALERAGCRVKKVSLLFPIAAAEWAEFADGLETIVVVEEKRPFLEAAIKDALYGRAGAPVVLGKSDPTRAILPDHGEFTVDLVATTLRRVLSDLGVAGIIAPAAARPAGPRTLLPLTTARTGFFCSGCPHSTGLKAPLDAKVGAGIGCHLLGLLVDRDEYGDISGYTQMGGEGAQWIGMAPFVTTNHIIQNVGDGTFHHSASLAIRWAVAARATMTYKILLNGTVGMTGGQDISGGMSVPDLVRNLLAEGVRKVVITTDDPAKYRWVRLPRGVKVRPRDEIVAAQEELARVPGVTVLIHDQQCAADRRRRWKDKGTRPTTRVAINDRVCEGCGDCNAKSQCLSVQPVETEFGRKTTIHQSSCNVDYSCLDGDCPSFMEVDTRNATRPTVAAKQPPAVTEPVHADFSRFAVHMTGIGGTGVVSVSAVVAEAAMIEGRRARTLDLTGNTVKAGPVVSQILIHAEGTPEPTAGIDAGGADLVLAFDLLTLMTPENLAPLAARRSVVVASTSVAPTAQMAIDPSIPYPTLTQIRHTVDATSRGGANRYLDAQALAQAVTGNHMAGNAVLLGVAVQTGALPLAPASIAEAIRRQGVAVEQTLNAFAWGRALAANPALVDDLIDTGTSDAEPVPAVSALGLPPALTHTLSLRYRDLVAYQNRRYAEEYLRVVADFARRDRAVGDTDLRATTIVAEQLHRLMAYKDEYEVARLHRLQSARAAIEREFGPGAKVSWKLHPPVLKSLGMKRKITVGPWFKPAFAGLATMKVVRGTHADPFGYTLMRRIERALIDDYVGLVAAVRSRLEVETYWQACDLLGAVAQVRGYDDVKLRNLRGYLEVRGEIAATMRVPLPDTGVAELLDWAEAA
ncbi:MAG TPA: indolepyruvate ferredoxin oxidoreductase family protein [Aldersonia sp.]